MPNPHYWKKVSPTSSECLCARCGASSETFTSSTCPKQMTADEFEERLKDLTDDYEKKQDALVDELRASGNQLIDEAEAAGIPAHITTMNIFKAMAPLLAKTEADAKGI